MAKKHLQDLARLLADKYKKVDEITASLALALADTALDPEEQKQFSILKGKVDAELSALTATLSAAAQNKLGEVLDMLNTQKLSYAEPLRAALDDLANQDIPQDVKEDTQALVKLYNAQIRNVVASIYTTKRIDFYRSLPSRKKKQLRLLCDKVCADCVPDRDCRYCTQPGRPLADRLQALYGCFSIFQSLDKAIEEFEQFVAKMQEPPAVEEVVDDLME